MNLKRVFGSLLTILGIIGLIYSAVIFVNTSGGARNIKSLIIYGIIGLIFFVSGMNLIRTTKDEA
jgi:predicted Na+-dependent transporter